MIDYALDRNLLLYLLSHKYAKTSFLVDRKLADPLDRAPSTQFYLILGTPTGQIGFGIEEDCLKYVSHLCEKPGNPIIEQDIDPECFTKRAERIATLAKVYL